MFVLVFVTYLVTLIIVTLAASSVTSGAATLAIIAGVALFGALAVGGAARYSDRQSPTPEEAEEDPHAVPQHATRELHPPPPVPTRMRQDGDRDAHPGT